MSCPLSAPNAFLDVRRADVARLHAKLVKKPYQANAPLPWFPPSGIGPRAGTKWRSPTIRRRESNAIRKKARERFLTSEELSRLGAQRWRMGKSEGLPYTVDETKRRRSTRPNPR